MSKPHHKACYFYNDEVGNYYYGVGHPMKPHRLRLTHDLLRAYGILDQFDQVTPSRAAMDTLTTFHTDDYVEFLRSVNSGNVHDHVERLSRFNINEDSPLFDGLWEYCQCYAGGSIGAAQQLTAGRYQYAVNWAGGLHHGKKQEASGFCYINDCVLAALELLRYFSRVLYVDIDVHHGDGVEEAFYASPRVMTVSFHKYGDYFPGTGALDDIGVGAGRGYAVNVPLREGANDATFEHVFRKVLLLCLCRIHVAGDWLSARPVFTQCDYFTKWCRLPCG